MPGAWTISVNRRQESPIFTKPTSNGGENRPHLANFRFVPIAGTISRHWSLCIHITNILRSATKVELRSSNNEYPRRCGSPGAVGGFRKLGFEIRRFLVQQIWQRRGISGMPTIVLVDKISAIRYSHIAKRLQKSHRTKGKRAHAD